MNTTKAELVTRKHMQRLSEMLGEAAIELIQRAARHDLSKLEPVELEPLQRMQDIIDSEGHAAFGSDEYKRRSSMVGPPLPDHPLTDHSESNLIIISHPGKPTGLRSQFLPALLTAIYRAGYAVGRLRWPSLSVFLGARADLPQHSGTSR